MPLEHGCGRRVRGRNIGREITAGKPPPQAAAIAYDEQRREGCANVRMYRYRIFHHRRLIDVIETRERYPVAFVAIAESEARGYPVTVKRGK